MHDLEAVAVFDAHLLERPARDNLAIALDRDLAWIQPQLVEHVGEAKPDRHLAEVTVQVNRDAFLKLHRAPQ